MAGAALTVLLAAALLPLAPPAAAAWALSMVAMCCAVMALAEVGR